MPLPPAIQPPVRMPEGMSVHRQPGAQHGAGDPYRTGSARDDLLVEWEWRSKVRVFLLIFSIAWWVFLVAWYVVVAAVDAPLLFLLVPLIHAAAGLVLGYVTAALWVNRSRLGLEGELLTVRHGPLPWPGARAVPVRELEQLYVVEGVAYYVNDRPVPGYTLCARTRRGELRLVKNLAEPEQARYLERVIEDALAITDEPVDGELGR